LIRGGRGRDFAEKQPFESFLLFRILLAFVCLLDFLDSQRIYE